MGHRGKREGKVKDFSRRMRKRTRPSEMLSEGYTPKQVKNADYAACSCLSRFRGGRRMVRVNRISLFLMDPCASWFSGGEF